MDTITVPLRAPTTSPGPAFGIRSFLVRLALVVAVLGVPILGTSFFFVSQVSSDIAMAARERSSLDAYERIASLFPALETLHRNGSDGDGAAARRTIGRIDVAVARLTQRYRSRPIDPESRRDLDGWIRQWQRIRVAPTTARIDAAIDSLRDVGAELEGDSTLDYDPNYAIQNLAAAILRQKPRAIAALRQTIDAVTEPAGPRASVPVLEAIATGRALQIQPIQLGHGDIETAAKLEPSLVASLDALESDADRATRALQRRVDAILRRGRGARDDAVMVERLGRVALDAQERVWRVTRVRAAELVDRRFDAAVLRRRALVSLSIAAVLVGTLGIVLIGRYMRYRDGIELAASRLDGERLRAELARVSIERALRLQEAQFRTVFESAELGIAIFDVAGTVIQRNPALSRMLVTTTEAELARQAGAIAFFAAPGRKPFTVERCVIDDGQRATWLALTFSGVYDDDVCRLVVLLARDATEEKTLQQRLVFDATHDALTHLANRAAFESALSEHIVGDRYGEPFALMYVDLDSFKEINDTHGHAAGDRVLLATAERLVAAVAPSDVCARLGGDEFAVLLRGIADRGVIDSIAERIGRSLAAPMDYGDVALAVSASIGIAVGSTRYTSTDRIKHDADVALYAVKGRGRNGHAFAVPADALASAERSAR